jgi:ABC-type lipoprotein export system ATPase subunit
MKLLAGLNAGGMTMIMVTHNSEYARSARRTLHVADGRLLNEPEISLLPPAYDSFAALEKNLFLNGSVRQKVDS